jgi:hypothetical protein
MKQSILTSKKIDEVLNDMIMHVIETEVRNYPFISVLSKKQIWFGGGNHFKNASEYIQKGLRANCGIRIPTDMEIDTAKAKYGYDALIKPWGELNRITNISMRKILKSTLDGNELDDIRILLGRGYVTNDGKLNLEQTAGIAVYVVFYSDHKKREIQNEWIKQQPKWVGYQILRNQVDHPQILAYKKREASSLVQMNRLLLKQEEYKELEPCVDRQQLPWNEN